MTHFFVIDSKLLSEKLQLLSGVLSSNSSLPILDNFLFKSEGKELRITASDLDNTMTTKIELEQENNFSIAIPGKMLIDLLKSFAHQPIKFHFENNTIDIVSNTGNYAIAYFDGEEFPKSPEVTEASSTIIYSKILLNAINKTLFATGNDDMRVFMNGVCFDFSTEKCVFVATDAHKLSKYTRNDIKATSDVKFIVPKKPLSVLKNALSASDNELEIFYNQTNAKFMFEDYELSCRLIDSAYPNYEVVIPKENDKRVEISRIKLLASLKCISIFSNKATNQVKLSFNGNMLSLSAEDKDYSNKGDESLTCNYTGEDLKIGFNSKYLIEILSNLNSEEISIDLSQPNRAGIIIPIDASETEEETLMLAMPVILN
jgi:DNA polymerase-3 subunit beta